MKNSFSVFLSISSALIFCGCSTPFKAERDLASQTFISPFATHVESKEAVVDAVISRLGPVRNQVNSQLCFGSAAADAITFYTGKKVSAFSVAVRYFQKRKGLDYIFFNPAGVIASQVGSDSRYMIGLASSTLRSSLDTTVCEDDQPADDLTYRDQNLKALWDAYRFYRAYRGPTKPTEALEKVRTQLSNIAPLLNSHDFVNKLTPYKPLDYALGDWFDRQCKIKIPANLKLTVVGSEVGKMSGDQIVAGINQALALGSMAVVHYDPGLLDAFDANFSQSVIGFHISSIVAKSTTSGGNQYLLRNTWGSDCRNYAPAIESRCDRGHIWVTEDEIRSHFTSVAYYRSNAN